MIFTREEAQPFVDWITNRLEEIGLHAPGFRLPLFDFTIVGAWRRGEQRIDQLDVLITTSNPGGLKIQPNMKEFYTNDQGVGGILMLDGKELEVCFHIATHRQVGALLWRLTGPESLVRALEKAASRKGPNIRLQFRPDGLFETDGEQSWPVHLGRPDEQEEAFAKVLGTEWLALLDPTTRAMWLANLPIVRVDNFVKVASSSNAEETYAVYLDAYGEPRRCNCKGFSYRAMCKHLEIARKSVEERS